MTGKNQIQNSTGRMQLSSRNTFTIDLVSNASMTTFPENSLAHFTTLLPEEMQLQGTWEVAVVEISWSNLIKNVTEGKFTVQKVETLTTEAISRKRHPHRSYTPGLVTMSDPRKRTHSILQENQFEKEKPHSIPCGCYPTIDCLLDTIFRQIFSKADHAILPVEWNICPISQILNVNFTGSSEDALKVRLVSKNLQNILGSQSLIDCGGQEKANNHHDVDENGEIDKKSRMDISKEQSHDARMEKYPVDLTTGCHTMFLYCDLVHNETLGDTRSALWRAIPLSTTTTSNNQRTFSKLQWRRLINCSIQSIIISLRSETGDLIPSPIADAQT